MEDLPTSVIAMDQWHRLIRFGGISALVIAVLLVAEVFVYAIIQDPGSPGETLKYFYNNPLKGLLHFDLLGMIAYLFFIPLTVSLYSLLGKSSSSVMAVGTILFFIGIAIFFSNNTGFAVLALSKQYAAAGTEEEKLILESSCRSMITLFNVNAFMVSYVIVSAAWLMISLVMLRSRLFTRFTAYSGILAGTSGIVAEIFENTSRVLFETAIAL